MKSQKNTSHTKKQDITEKIIFSRNIKSDKNDLNIIYDVLNEKKSQSKWFKNLKSIGKMSHLIEKENRLYLNQIFLNFISLVTIKMVL